MHRIARIVVAVFIGSLLCGASLASAQGQPGGPMPPPPNHGPAGPYNPDPKLGIQDHSYGQPMPSPAQMQPPPFTLPAWAGGRVFSSAERNHPHSHGHGDKANPMGTGHRFGTPHPPMPPLPPGVTPPPLRAEDDSDSTPLAQDPDDPASFATTRPD
jgi:hypothetical protein